MSAEPRPKPAEFHVFDTTLRDGSQQEGLNLSVVDKLAIAALLDELGVGFIEGGWPGANPTDTAFFAAMADGALKTVWLQSEASPLADTDTSVRWSRSPHRRLSTVARSPPPGDGTSMTG